MGVQPIANQVRYCPFCGGTQLQITPSTRGLTISNVRCNSCNRTVQFMEIT